MHLIQDRTKRLRVLAGLLAVGLLLISSAAQAKGTVRVHTTVVDEVDGEWKIKLTIDYGSEPHIPHVPMRFTFKPVAIYERALTDDSPDKPVERRVALQGQVDKHVSMDVGFADAMGKTFKITNFGMKLTRDADFEAGEYEMTVKLAEGGTLGGKTLLKLRGNNKTIDRRSIVFTAEAPKKKKDPGPDKQAAAADSKPKPSEDYGPDLSDIPDVSSEEAKSMHDPHAPPEVDQKQGGCGCVIPGTSDTGRGWYALLPLAGVLFLRRRRG
jgi:hypothetical protein